MKTIPLNNGKVAIVDDEDFDWLNQWRWYAQKGRKTWYARRAVVANGKQSIIRMHRLVACAKSGQVVDHKNRDGLDNRRSNLRLTDGRGNVCNRGVIKGRYKGVCQYPAGRKKKWVARICCRYKNYTIGYYDSEEDAAIVYNIAAQLLHGEFAYLNPV